MIDGTYAGPGADLLETRQGGSLKARLQTQGADQIVQDPLLQFHVAKAAATALGDRSMRAAGDIVGGSGSDNLAGGTGNDSIFGMAGNDYLSGQAGDDCLHGGLGIDVLYGGTGADTLNGGSDNDWANYGTSLNGVSVSLLTNRGTSGDATGDKYFSIENLSGSARADSLTGSNGVNALYGRGGNDILNGEGGNDVLRGGIGADLLNGGDGFDWANYRDSQQGVSVDLLTGTGAWGDAAGDQLFAIENIAGSEFYDLLKGSNGSNVLFGYGGGDTLHGEGGDDRADGGAGDDFVTGGDGTDILMGGTGNDLIDGGSSQDVIKGGAGDDVIYGGTDHDIVVYDFAWADITATYDSSDYSLWISAPDGTDHVFAALIVATTTGTYRYDVPTASWVHDSTMTGSDWMGL